MRYLKAVIPVECRLPDRVIAVIRQMILEDGDYPFLRLIDERENFYKVE